LAGSDGMINVLEDIGVIERIDMIKHTRRNGDEG
jgi:Fur family ferric uptake transcriptional regulator